MIFLIIIFLLLGCSKNEGLRFQPVTKVGESDFSHLKKMASDLNLEVNRAPVAGDGTTAKAVTDIVINFVDIDPAIDGISIKKDGTVMVVLDPAFENVGMGNNTVIILQGWPQSPPAPPPLVFSTSVVDQTITTTFKQDYLVGVSGPGPKQAHLALFGFRNPKPGVYPVLLTIKPDPNSSETRSGVGHVHIIPKARPAVSAVSIFSGSPGPPPPFNNAIYQTVEEGDEANTVGLYLWDKLTKPFVGIDVQMTNPNHGLLVSPRGSTVGQVQIHAPTGASAFSLTTEGPSVLGSAFLTAVDVGILKTKFIPDPSVIGSYRLHFRMNNGNTQELFVRVVPD